MGMSVNQSPLVKLFLLIPKELRVRLKVYAAAHQITMKELVIRAVEKMMED